MGATNKCLVLIKRKRQAKEKEALINLFNNHDDDGDGIMSYNEFKQMFEVVDPELTDRHIVELFRQAIELAEEKNIASRVSPQELGQEDRRFSIDEDEGNEEAVIDPEIFVEAVRRYGYKLGGNGVWVPPPRAKGKQETKSDKKKKKKKTKAKK